MEGSSSTSDRNVDLRPGDKITVELAGLGTAGYRWQDVIDGDPGIVSVSWQRGAAQGLAEKVAGKSAAEIATVRAERVGQVTVRFVQVRPWERNGQPLDSQTITVRVRPANGSGDVV